MEPVTSQNLSPEILRQLEQLANDFHDGYLTEKGYMKKKMELIGGAGRMNQGNTLGQSRLSTVDYLESNSELPNSIITNNNGSDINSDDFFRPSHRINVSLDEGSVTNSNSNTQSVLYNDEFLEKYHNLNNNYESNIRKELQKPLDPRDVSLMHKSETEFSNIALILRQRARIYEKEPAILVVDEKGRESKVITWDKLYFRAEKIAKQIKNKGALYHGDRVCLIYQNVEVIDFIVAFYGCLLSGVVAVPLNSALPTKDLISVMNDTQSHLCLMSDSVFKYFEKLGKQNNSNVWPKGVAIWKTSEMGTYKPNKKDSDPPFKKTDLAYIDYTRGSDGELKGVVLSHNTVLNQMKMLNKMLSTSPGIRLPLMRSTLRATKPLNNVVSSLDVRGSLGLLVSVLFTVYSGNLFIWMHSKTAEVPGLLANTLSIYKTSILLTDYYTLKHVVYNYETYPLSTINFSKRRVDLSFVKWCLIDTYAIDCEFNEHLSDRWFKPLGNKNGKRILSPVLSLSEHGGAIISMRDWYGKEDQLGCIFNHESQMDMYDEFSDDDSKDKLSEVLIDKVSLSTNSVKIINDHPPSMLSEINNEDLDFVRVGAFGYPLPDTTLALVNPETKLLSGVLEVGEIWVDSSCISGGYWGLHEDTEEIFQAECSDYEGILSVKFVRTNLLGFIYNGKIYVLGLYEDRINQRVTWYDQYLEMNDENNLSPNSQPNRSKSVISADSTNLKKLLLPEYDKLDLSRNLSNRYLYKYHYSSHLVKTLAKHLPGFKDCAFFNVKINREFIPVGVMESSMYTDKTQGSRIELQLMLTQAFDILEKHHNVRLFFMIVTEPGMLSKTFKGGRLEIAHTLTKRRFLEGKLPSVYVSFKSYNSLGSIYRGEDITGGIWSPYSSLRRRELLNHASDQVSGLSEKEFDNRFSSSLTSFDNLTKLIEYRSNKQSDDIAYTQIEGVAIRESKQINTWKKLESKIFSVCSYILEKKTLEAGDHVILCYPLSEEFIVCLLSCWLAGLIVIPIPPFGKTPKILSEDAEAFVSIIKEFKVKAVFVTNETESQLKNKNASSEIKAHAKNMNVIIPKYRNTYKHLKTSSNGKSTYKKMEMYRNSKPAKSKKSNYCIIWLNFTSDNKYISVGVTHSTLLKMCFNLKETCQLTNSSPLLGCTNFTFGLGFLQSCCMGLYLGTTTHLLTTSQYYTYPATFFQAIERYRIENVYITSRMFDYAFSKNATRDIKLKAIKNLMVTWENNRENATLLSKYYKKFIISDIKLKKISNVYNHPLNPLISTRSLLSFEPVTLWLDPHALSNGYVSIVDPKDSPEAISVVDSGIVSMNTEVIIVNPATREICKVGEFGEIWVSSNSNVDGYAGRDDTASNREMINFRLEGRDNLFMRTMDFGFLHTITEIVSHQPVEMQLLYNLGHIDETFEYCGLQYFAKDIENCIESFAGISRCCIFKAGEYMVLVASTNTKKSLSTIAPLMVLKLLNRFKLVIDIISFVDSGGLMVSREGSLQRMIIAKKWMNRSLRVIDTFGVNYGENEMIKAVKMQEWVEDRLPK